MPDLTNYPSKLLPLPSHISALIERLEEDGFDVHTSKDSHSKDSAVYTIVVSWDDEYVGYTKHDMWRGGYLLGYHFGPGRADGGNACPPGFNRDVFAKEHGVSPDGLKAFENEGRHYLRIKDVETALQLMRHSASEIDALKATPGQQLEDNDEAEIERDIQGIYARKDIPPTVKKRLVDARRGQGWYRRQLEKVFGKCCAVTGLQLRQALRASHALAWRPPSATDARRLDSNNGLLLSANLDALFDRHLITFNEEGQVRVSRRISPADRQLLPEIGNLRRRPTPQQWAYLQMHNEVFDQAETAGRRTGRNG